MHKLLPILHVLSKLIMLFAGLYVVPAVVSIIYQDGTLDEFLVSMFVGMALGLLLWAVTRRYEAELKPRDGFMLVSFLWIGFAATATTPFLLHFPDLGFTSAFFEAMSGLTTRVPRYSPGWITCPRPSTSGDTSSTGWAAWASSCWPWPCCRSWGSGACSSTRPKHRAR